MSIVELNTYVHTHNVIHTLASPTTAPPSPGHTSPTTRKYKALSLWTMAPETQNSVKENANA